MKEGKTFEKNLPEGYEAVYTVDAKNKKVGILMNVVSFVVLILTVFLVKHFACPNFDLGSLMDGSTRVTVDLFVFCAILFGYLVLHECLHGLVYKIMTGEKLTFGLTLSVAYCGVPNIFVYRKTALCSLLAPFCTFLPVFLLMTIFMPTDVEKLLSGFLLGMHIGGCSGDLYDTFLYLFRFRSPDILMQDTGPKQTFYRRVSITKNSISDF